MCVYISAYYVEVSYSHIFCMKTAEGDLHNGSSSACSDNVVCN